MALSRAFIVFYGHGDIAKKMKIEPGGQW